MASMSKLHTPLLPLVVHEFLLHIPVFISTSSKCLHIVSTGAGIHVFTGVQMGSMPNNGLVVSVDPENNGTRLHLLCGSDSMTAGVGTLLGLNGNSFNGGRFFTLDKSRPGEFVLESTTVKSALTDASQGVYTCCIPLQSGEMREITIGLYMSGFNSEFY